MSLALARKYRPKKFSEVAVQSHVATTLRNAIASDRIAHAYLFCGPRGTGKTTLARVLAMALNCENKSADHEPCGVCASCTRIWAGSASLDVVEIDAASNRGVDDARDLRERAMYAPSGEDHHKVYIIDEAHMLTREAWNALLKILEEPPPRVVFVFATTEPQKIAQAAAPVLSRVQRFDLKRIGPADVRTRLADVLKQENIPIESDALGMLAALSLTDQVLSLGAGSVTADRVREALGLVHEDEYLALLDVIADRRAGDVFVSVGRLADFGVDFGLLLSGIADILRAQLAISLGGTLPDLSDQMKAALLQRKDKLASGDLLRMLTLLVDIEPHFRRSGQQQLLFETLMVRFALLDRTMDIQDVLRGMGSAPTGGGGARREAPGIAPSRESQKAPRMLADSAPTAPTQSAPIRGVVEPSRVREQVASEAASGRVEAPPPRPSAPAPRSASSSNTLADSVPAKTKRQPLDINRLSEHWDDVIESVRTSGRGLLASTLAEATPIAVNAGGAVLIGVSSEALAQALEMGADSIVLALGTVFDGATKLVVKLAGEAKTGRLTAEDVIANRVAMLRKRDPVLDAAIDALDLKLLD
jgi:DNA polymerase-3 subunit gamma/tau